MLGPGRRTEGPEYDLRGEPALSGAMTDGRPRILLVDAKSNGRGGLRETLVASEYGVDIARFPMDQFMTSSGAPAPLSPRPDKRFTGLSI